MSRIAKVGLIWTLLALLQVSCASGSQHTRDSVMEQNFLNHEKDFNALLASVEMDPKLSMIGARDLRYGDVAVHITGNDLSELDRVGFPRDAWQRYQRQLRDLGLQGGVLKAGGHVEFRAEQGSIRNGDSYKGYEYSVETPQGLKQELDNYRVSDYDRDKAGGWSVHKRLKNHWYLYLFVNG